MLELSCAKCGNYLITYQKDGPGPLLRCYWDRIHAPCHMTKLSESSENEFRCINCCTEIGKQGIYEKESRLAFFLILGSFKEEEKN